MYTQILILHTYAVLLPLQPKLKARTHTHAPAPTQTFPTFRSWRHTRGSQAATQPYLPVARKRRAASRSWGDILTFISLSVGLKAEKSCFLSRWVIFFFVLLSAEEKRWKHNLKPFLHQGKHHFEARTVSWLSQVTGCLNWSYPKLFGFSGTAAVATFSEKETFNGRHRYHILTTFLPHSWRYRKPYVLGFGVAH